VRRLILSVIIAICTVLLSIGLAVAKEPATPELTLQEAVDRAMELSKTLKIQETEKGKASEQLSDAQDEVKYTPIGIVNQQIQTAYSSLLQSELNYQIKRKNYLSLQDDIKEQVIEKYCSVLSATETLEKTKKSLAQADWERRMSLLKLQVGTLAPVNIAEINASYENAQGELVQSEQELNKAYIELNALVGFWPEDRPQLVTNVEYAPLEITSLTAEVNRAINESTDLWSALQSVTIERQDLRMTVQPYEIEKLEIEIAQLTADQVKDELEKQFLSLYHDIVSLESGIKAAEQSVSAAEEAFRVALVQYDVGMGVEGDILAAELNLATAKNTLVGLKYNHSSTMATYRNLTGRDILPPVNSGVNDSEQND